MFDKHRKIMICLSESNSILEYDMNLSLVTNISYPKRLEANDLCAIDANNYLLSSNIGIFCYNTTNKELYKINNDKIKDSSCLRVSRNNNIYISSGSIPVSYTHLSILTTYANPDVKWETSIQTNIGFDMAFMKNMFTLSGDIYRTDKKDMLATVKLPASTGVGTGTNSLVTKNVGNMLNKGIELNLGYRYAKRKFSLKTNVNFSKNVNEIDVYKRQTSSALL